jgi:hypothetical protein
MEDAVHDLAEEIKQLHDQDRAEDIKKKVKICEQCIKIVSILHDENI